jgi:hypothetical protein
MLGVMMSGSREELLKRLVMGIDVRSMIELTQVRCGPRVGDCRAQHVFGWATSRPRQMNRW